VLPPELIDRLKRRTAALAIGASTLRNQGSLGVINAARTFLAELDPREFVAQSEPQFLTKLDKATARLQAAFPRGARHWGGARKAINIFLRDVLYNRYLSAAFGVNQIRPWLEVPLDKYSAVALRVADASLPKWKGVKYLTPELNRIFQAAAATAAKEKGVARVDMDIWYWRADALPGDDGFASKPWLSGRDTRRNS
jgi:hypothetical protein